MSSESARFGTAINCMDGRTQIPVIEWMRKRYRVSYVDMITEPGVDAVLAENDDTRTIESIKRKVRISTEKHGSRLIAVVGHYDCAGNPVDMHTHLAQIQSAVERMASWGFKAQVSGYGSVSTGTWTTRFSHKRRTRKSDCPGGSPRGWSAHTGNTIPTKQTQAPKVSIAIHLT